MNLKNILRHILMARRRALAWLVSSSHFISINKGVTEHNLNLSNMETANHMHLIHTNERTYS